MERPRPIAVSGPVPRTGKPRLWRGFVQEAEEGVLDGGPHYTVTASSTREYPGQLEIWLHDDGEGWCVISLSPPPMRSVPPDAAA